MTINSNGNNQMIVAITNIYLQVSETEPEKLDELANQLVQLILSTFPNELKSTNPFSLPYKDITDIVFYGKYTLLSDSIYNFKGNVKKAVITQYEVANSDKHHKTKQKYINRFMYIHDKLVEHILLAHIQSDFIKNTIKDTKIIAYKAKNTAENAQKIANKAEDTAENAQKIADKAEDTATKAEETYKSMFANYVTILGIFTAIIVTIFGGLNVINTVVKQINDNKTIILQITALLILCEVVLLYFLANTIVWISNTPKSKLHCLFWGVVITCIGVIITLNFCPIT